MAKRLKASKLKKGKEEEEGRTSVNNLYQNKETDDPVSINYDLNQEETVDEMDEAAIVEAYHAETEEADNSPTEDPVVSTDIDNTEETPLIEEDPIELQQQLAAEEAKKQGLNLPDAAQQRDPKKDKTPIEGEDLGLAENDFLLSRKVTKSDLELHINSSEEGLLGSNERKPKDFLNVFRRGPSTKEKPKVDTSAAIENNAIIQKEIAAKQLLRNYHSNDNNEKNNTLQIFNELKLDEELISEINGNKGAHKDQNLIEIIRELL
jgi:hypothetical protein